MKRALPILLLAVCAVSAHAQIPGIKLPRVPGVDSLFKKGPAITTSLKDAKWEVADKDGFSPEAKPLGGLDRGANGGFVLREGTYGATVQSYCLHAGTYGPSRGDAYLYAPPKGPAERAVIDIVSHSVAHPEIEQHDIQLLLWAIIARTKVSELTPNLQRVASTLLTPKQILDLNGGAMGILGEEALQRGLISEPPILRQVHEAENQLRQQLTLPNATYDEMARIAVLTGNPPPGAGSREVPRGRWSLHPDGYYVRYLPNGYTNTRLEIYVPTGCKAIGKEFNPATHIAVPCDTARQRLIQSGRLYNQG